jgi:hypothetical protein
MTRYRTTWHGAWHVSWHVSWHGRVTTPVETGGGGGAGYGGMLWTDLPLTPSRRRAAPKTTRKRARKAERKPDPIRLTERPTPPPVPQPIIISLGCARLVARAMPVTVRKEINPRDAAELQREEEEWMQEQDDMQAIKMLLELL